MRSILEMGFIGNLSVDGCDHLRLIMLLCLVDNDRELIYMSNFIVSSYDVRYRKTFGSLNIFYHASLMRNSKIQILIL